MFDDCKKKKKRLIITSVGENTEKLQLLYIANGNVKQHSCLENGFSSVQFSSVALPKLLYELGSSLLPMRLYVYAQCVQLSVTQWSVACQAPLSMGFSRQEYQSGLSFHTPGNLPDPGIKPVSSALAGGFFTTKKDTQKGATQKDTYEVRKHTFTQRFVHECSFQKQSKCSSTHAWIMCTVCLYNGTYFGNKS